MASSSASSPSQTFTVRRCQPELVAPAIPTPHEIKLLSDIDDQEYLRFYYSMIQVYRKKSSMAGKDPVEVVREALAKTLVFYYPFAGRLREGPNRKLMVDCTAEGVLFIEADADVTLDQFGADSLQPPLSWSQKVLYHVQGSDGITNSPLLFIQVTRFNCGDFVVGTRWNHTIVDGAGLSLFMNAWAEMARGARKPSISPVWHRELLMARNPPRITCNHYEYDQVQDTKELMTNPNEGSYENLVNRSFFFGSAHVAAIRRLVPRDLEKHCTTFDVIAACFWRCRTKALEIEAEKDVRIMYPVNARGRFNPKLPLGYYGNASAMATAVTTAGELCGKPLGYAVELIHKVKNDVTEEYVHSVADLMVSKGRCMIKTVRSFNVSDLTRAGFTDLDFGWGKALSGAPGLGATGPFPGATFIVSYKNEKGEEGLVLPIWLPREAMNRFVEELNCMLRNQNQPTGATATPTFIRSTL